MLTVGTTKLPLKLVLYSMITLHVLHDYISVEFGATKVWCQGFKHTHGAVVMREGSVSNEVTSSKACKLKVTILLPVTLWPEICHLRSLRSFPTDNRW